MSKRTLTKLNRTHTLSDNGKVVERSIPIPAQQKEKAGDCYICHEPVMASNGQLLKWVQGRNGEHLYSHKKCRKNNK